MTTDRGRGPCCLAVDVGNTTTCLGFFDASSGPDDEPIGTYEMTTPARVTADEASTAVEQVLLSRFGGLSLCGSVLSCVVPVLADPWARALDDLVGRRPLVVGPGLKSGMRMRYKDPAEVGSDRLADALAARTRYDCPIVAVDLGTTLNMEVVGPDGAFEGGLIAPGIALGAAALANATAKLPMIELREPKSAIGRSTREAMQSGVVFGEVARVDGLLDRVFMELGEPVPVVLTGEGAESMARLLSHETIVDETLTLRGLHQIWAANRR